MKKYIVPLLLLLIISGCSKPKVEIKSIDELLSKHFEAIGAEALKNAQTLIHRDEITQSPDGKAVTQIEILAKKPNLYFFKSVENGETVVLGQNKRVNYAYIMKEYRERPAEITFTAFNSYAYGFASVLYAQMNNWKIELTGKENFNGKELYRIKVIRPSSGDNGKDNVFIYDIDAETFLVFRMINGGATQFYTEYKEVKGVKYASIITSDYDGVKSENYFKGTIKEFNINGELPDLLFDPDQFKGK